jgi:nitrite reductase (NAD(P)H)
LNFHSFGLIATEKGYNLFVGGNGGAQPRHCDLLAKDVPPEEIIPMIDRYLMFYIRTADRLQRTARWIEALPGGIEYLKDVVIHDKLGICADLEKQMEELVGSYFCEWTETLKRPELQKHFKQFGNTDDQIEGVEIIKEREQERPTNWPQTPAEHDFKGHQWSTVTWQPLIKEDYFSDGPPAVSSANVKRGNTQLAVFKIKGKYYATQQMCPHKRAFILSDGLIGDDDSGKFWVSCPYHKRNFELNGEQAGRCSNDETLNIATFPVECRDDGWVYVKLPPVEELDSVLGTDKWKVRKDEGPKPFEKVDKIYKGMKARKGGASGTVYRKTAAANEGIDW